jgi:hypothetical protein
MSGLPMTTQQWQDHKLGPSLNRSMKWFAVDLHGASKVIYDELAPAMMSAAQAIASFVEALAPIAEMWEAQG